MREEDPARYKAGGYHPVRLGEVFNGRYTVFRKLGAGVYATIWLVRDQRTSSFAALKISVASRIKGLDELTFVEKIAQADGEPCRYIVKFFESFEHEGPNGVHICTVFEVLGPSFSIFRERERAAGRAIVVPTPIMKRIAFQLLTALEHLHGLGIIHTDLKPDNVVFAIPDIDNVITRDLASQVEHPPSEETDPHVPYQPLPSQPLPFTLSTDPLVKLIDFGNAQFLDAKPDLWPIQPEALRAPEVLLRADWNAVVDIWNYGCLIYELYSAHVLFELHSGLDYSTVDLHLAMMQSICGEFPAQLLAVGKYTDRYFSPHNKHSTRSASPQS